MLALVTAAGCRPGTKQAASGSASAPPAASNAASSSSAIAPPRSSAPATAAPGGSGLSAMDLGPHGLPLVVDVPECAKASAPMVKLADNEKDVILGCGDPMEAALAGPVFAIQLGPVKGKIWKKEIAETPGFTGFTKDEADFLQWREGLDPKAQTFMVRRTIGGSEYLCFSQFPSADEGRLSSMIAACRSLREKR